MEESLIWRRFHLARIFLSQNAIMCIFVEKKTTEKCSVKEHIAIEIGSNVWITQSSDKTQQRGTNNLSKIIIST